MQKILILEDKKAHVDALVKIISDLGKDIEVLCAFDEKDAYKIAMEQQINLFLVDIILHAENSGDVTGLRFVQEIRSVKKYSFSPIIFITSLEDPKLYSYSQLHCFGYIEKPFSVSQVRECVLKALEFPIITDKDRCVYFRKSGIVYSKRINDIVYIESSRRKITIHCVNDKLEIPYKTCDEMIQELGSDLFIRCSRYAIINKSYIENIDYANRYVKLRTLDSPVEIGVMMKDKFKRGIEHGIYST